MKWDIAASEHGLLPRINRDPQSIRTIPALERIVSGGPCEELTVEPDGGTIE